MKIMVMALLFPVVLFSQSNQYLFLQTEVDARNMIFGGTVNDRGYNGVFKAGFSAQWFRADIFYETFAALDYQTGGLNLSYIFRYDHSFKMGLGVQMGLINKPKKLTPSVGLNGILEYHFTPFFISARLERKVRTDWDIIVNSGFVGVGYRLN
jgi:hypothetical protein